MMAEPTGVILAAARVFMISLQLLIPFSYLAGCMEHDEIFRGKEKVVYFHGLQSKHMVILGLRILNEHWELS